MSELRIDLRSGCLREHPLTSLLHMVFTRPMAQKNTRRRTKAAHKADTGKRDEWTNASVAEVFRRFEAVNPTPRSELEYINPFTLLVAVVLSAKATDAEVNRVTAA